MLIAMNKFFIHQGFEDAFEKRWREHHSLFDQSPGFVGFRLLKQVLNKSEKIEFISFSEWIDEKSFLQWTESEESRRAHSQSSPMPPGMMAGAPEFRAYRTILDQGYGDLIDFSNSHLDQLVEKTFVKESSVQKLIAQENKEMGLPLIHISPFEGHLIEILLRMIRAEKGVEIGTLGGSRAHG